MVSTTMTKAELSAMSHEALVEEVMALKAKIAGLENGKVGWKFGLGVIGLLFVYMVTGFLQVHKELAQLQVTTAVIQEQVAENGQEIDETKAMVAENGRKIDEILRRLPAN